MAATEKKTGSERVEALKAMASTSAALAKEPKKRILLPLERDDQADVVVGINGVAFQIQRGEEVDVPESVYNTLMEQQKADQEALKRSRALSNRFRDKIK